jgi:hypothetical protein
MIPVSRALGCLAVLLSLVSVVFAASDIEYFIAASDIGHFVSCTASVNIQRGDASIALDPEGLSFIIQVSDTISTDASGRAKIEFNDGSTVALARNTSVNMLEYANAGDKSAFAINVPQGMIRAMTGTIVEQNPDGFKITAPETTMGIRGTTITLLVEGAGATVFVEEAKRAVQINGSEVPAGYKWIFSEGQSRQERITEADRQFIDREFASAEVDAEPEAEPRNTLECIRNRQEKQKRWELAPPNSRGPYPDYKCPGEYQPKR